MANLQTGSCVAKTHVLVFGVICHQTINIPGIFSDVQSFLSLTVKDMLKGVFQRES